MRPADPDRADGGMIHVDLVVRQHPAALQRLRQSFGLPQLPHERHADHPRSRFHRHAELQVRVAGDLHVLFPAHVPGEAGLAGAGVAGRGRPALRSPPDHEALQQPAIEPHVELLRPAHAHDVVLVLPAELHPDDVFAVDREVVANCHAAARAERQILALAVVLHDVQRNLERLDPGRGRRQAGCEPRRLPRYREVAFQMDSGDGEDVGEVVEAAVRRLVTRQQRLHVEAARVQCDQVTQGVAVFRAVEAVDGADAARARIGGPRPIELGLEPAGHRVIGLGVRAGPPRRRHRSRPQLFDDTFPYVRMVARPRGVQIVERQPGRTDPRVVAADAIGFEERPGGRRGRGSLSGRTRPRRCRRAGGQREDEDTDEERRYAHNQQPEPHCNAPTSGCQSGLETGRLRYDGGRSRRPVGHGAARYRSSRRKR